MNTSSGKTLTGKRILLTGACGGIGSAIARELTRCEARVILVDVSLEPLLDLVRETGQASFVCDLTDSEQRLALAGMVEAKFGALDGLVQCAGLNAFGLYDNQTDEQIERLLKVNLIAPMQLTRRMIPLLEKGNQPVIVSLGSVFAHIGFPGFSIYSASKFGMHGYTEALRRELADGPVRVAWISPRATRTAMNAGVIDDMNRELKVNYDEPQAVSDAVVAALSKPQRDRVLGYPEKIFARLNQLFPSLVDGSLAKQLPIIRKYNTIQKESLS